MDDLHLLRPLWLLALPVGWALAWLWLGGGKRAQGGWSRVVDEPLKPHVLSRPDATRSRLTPLAAVLAAWTFAVLGLAGPTFERVEVPAFRADDALVVALDLSRSMNAADVEPDRLTRARLKILSLLERRRSGQTALVVFSSHAFTVTPLTSDTRTISSLIGALSTDIMPSRGSYPEAGLERAAKLLEQTGMTDGDVLLVTDADVTQAAIDAARALGGDGFTVHVLGVGTTEGAPIADEAGGFVLDAAGDVVVPRVDLAALERLAQAGGGRFAQLAADDSDLDRLFGRGATPLAAASGSVSEDAELGADVWRDEGVWFALLVLPLLALTFRRGWVTAVALALVLPMPRADAFEWADLWQRSDQRGRNALEAEAPARAAELFEDPQWRAVARYRAGEFDGSAASLIGIDSADAHYNRGTALARAGQIRAAIAAYDRTLELDPAHDDARHNRALLEDLLEQQEQQSGQQSGDGGEGQSGERREGDAGQQQQGSESGGEQQGQPGERSQQPGQSQDGQDGERQAQASPEDGDGEPQSGDGGAEAADGADGERVAAAADDLEQWASDQAAEQWLRRIPQDPGGLLRRKFLYQYQRLGVDQDGNYVYPGNEREPW